MPDTIDAGILKLLQQNAYITTKKIALKLHLSNIPINERIKRLGKDGFDP